MSNQGTVVAGGSHTRGSFNNESSNHSTYPSTSPTSPRGPREMNQEHQHHRDNLNIVKNSSQPISLEGIVDLTNTVDTTVTTRQLPGTFHLSSFSKARRPPRQISSRSYRFNPCMKLSPLNASRLALQA
jgi:hypothetical protein